MECPNCKLENPAGAVRCDCGYAFVNEANRDIAAEPNPASSTTTKKCPFCAETILADARKCRFCGEFLNPADLPVREMKPSHLSPPVRMAIPFFILLFIAVIVVFGLRVRSGTNSSASRSAPSSDTAEQEHKRPVSAEERSKFIQVLQNALKDLDCVITAHEDLLRMESKDFADPVHRAEAWTNFSNLVEDSCKFGFHRIQLGYGAESEDFSLGCDGSPRTEVKLLLLRSWNWHVEYGYATVEGQVLNISDQRLENVEAVASFYDANGGFVTSADALIDYNPVLPHQVSAFKVPASYNPAMKRAQVEFKYLMGGSVPFLRYNKKP